MPYAIYILKCSDGSYYTGSTKDLDARFQEHQTGVHPDAYTFRRRPVELVWSEIVETYHEAFQWEHQIKGWSRAKKEALIHGDFDGIHEIVKAERSENKINSILLAERNVSLDDPVLRLRSMFTHSAQDGIT